MYFWPGTPAAAAGGRSADGADSSSTSADDDVVSDAAAEEGAPKALVSAANNSTLDILFLITPSFASLLPRTRANVRITPLTAMINAGTSSAHLIVENAPPASHHVP